ncbi:MAG: hypothetical protein KAJ29_06730 [Alphaproteobacteria bacterium]|nr:hypothetical protein [Alphaproteobacteria bacterium]
MSKDEEQTPSYSMASYNLTSYNNTASYNKVINFLCDNEESGESAITDEEQQDYAHRILKKVAIQTCLPYVSAEFDNEGRMSLDFSEEDTDDFKRLFQERWPVVETALQRRDNILDAIPKPERPAFFDEPGNSHLPFLKGEGLLPELDDVQRQQYKDYSEHNALRSEAASIALRILEPVRKGWDEENSQYDFLSLKDENARSYYDTCRGVGISQDEHVTPEP